MENFKQKMISKSLEIINEKRIKEQNKQKRECLSFFSNNNMEVQNEAA